jgi:hypothetical protein
MPIGAPGPPIDLQQLGEPFLEADPQRAPVLPRQPSRLFVVVLVKRRFVTGH